jgi:lantibiotic modifying enzyme
MPTWTPILDGDDAIVARRSIETIAHGLAPFRARHDLDPSLTQGLAGDAVLYAHLARAWQGDWADRARAELDRAIDGLAEVPMSAGLFTGFPGVAWAFERIARTLESRDSDDANEDIDAVLLEHVSRCPWTDLYDLIGGLVGIGAYALERLDRGRGRELLALVIARLGELARREDGGLTWHTLPQQLPAWQRELAPHGYRNLGLAHGVPGVIAMCGHAVVAEIAGARALLDGAVAWLLAQARPAGASRFGLNVPIDHPCAPFEARVAWCYGDLGIAIALVGAARRAGRDDWERDALELAAGAAARPIATAGARDAMLCHGSAGNAHLFNRLYQATGDARFLTAARGWFADLRRHAIADHPLGGFRTWNFVDPDRVEWHDAAGLLEGAGGVALALLAAIDTREPTWDRVLLADL